ncbi:hypothetical protein CPB83DRAFT_831835 [Crepidotus variabilis]|uniref:F-box domain-containing protein n=1 Tax=Crepidotus variabilis TaxID=179855 RepID=A0A9P6ERR1_9AGAR|nr:hypothetical protein CPB83DRAFT_831835 [Crepidotus variabilis]
MASPAPSPTKASLMLDIADLQEQLVSKSRQLNSFSPICGQKFQDILPSIFWFLSPDGELTHPLHKASTTGPTDDLRHASQVCHAWRKLALDSSSLWGARLDCNRESVLWLLELIRRSKGRPVNIVAFFGNSPIQSVASSSGSGSLSRIIPKLTAVSSIAVYISSLSPNSHPDQYSTFRKLLCSKILINGATVSICEGFDSFYAIPPLQVKPRSMTLFGATANLTLSCFDQLHSLSLARSAALRSADDLIATLRHLTVLTHLRLERALDRPNVYLTTPPELRLSYLQSLTLIDELNNGIGYFLASIVSHRPYTLNLECEVVPPCTEHELSSLMQGIKKWSAVWIQSPSVTTLNKTIHIISSRRKLSIKNPTWLYDYSFSLTLRWKMRTSSRDMWRIESNLMQAMRPVLQHTIQLHVTPDWKSKAVCPTTFWEVFPSLRILRFNNHPQEKSENEGLLVFLRALVNDFERYPENPFRHLQTISVEGVCSSTSAENLVATNLAVLVELGSNEGNLSELQIYRSCHTIGDTLKWRLGRTITVTVLNDGSAPRFGV